MRWCAFRLFASSVCPVALLSACFGVLAEPNTNGDSGDGETNRPTSCGNGAIDVGEACDDGNDDDGDGCDGDCMLPCGQALGSPFAIAADGHCYARAAEPYTYANAMSLCDGVGAQLVVVSSTSELDIARVVAGGPNFWVQASNAIDGVHYAPRNTEDIILPWAVGEPDNGPCAMVRSDGTYDSIEGENDPLVVVCEFAFDACGDGIVDDGEDCDDGNATDDDGCGADCSLPCGGGFDRAILTGDGTCYGALLAPRGATAGFLGSWDDAAQRCEAAGGALVSINDDDEADVVAQLAADIDSPWVGARDSNTEGVFMQPDGTTLGSDRFAANAVDGGSAQNCAYVLAFADGLLGDAACDGSGTGADVPRGLICEIPAGN